MTRAHPNQLLDTLISLIILNYIWQFAALSLHLGGSESCKTLEQKFIFLTSTLNPHGRSIDLENELRKSWKDLWEQQNTWNFFIN